MNWLVAKNYRTDGADDALNSFLHGNSPLEVKW
jgi:hypothetical protein